MTEEVAGATPGCAVRRCARRSRLGTGQQTAGLPLEGIVGQGADAVPGDPDRVGVKSLDRDVGGALQV
jgi:hypothetical protein